MNILYTTGIHLLYLLMIMAALFNAKARQWVKGRMGWRKKVDTFQSRLSPVLWFHAASLGEFEQGMPVIESFKKRMPEAKIVVTFYSPSGYEIRKNYASADLVCYLPLDTSYNAEAFIKRVKPSAVFFIKYEFWYFYLKALQKKGIPVYLISAIFRNNQVFFKWYGGWYRKQLMMFRRFFVQDQESVVLLKHTGITNALVSGDTRFDRVASIAAAVREIKAAQLFVKNAQFVIVFGSTWPADNDIIVPWLNKAPSGIKCLIAPHEIHPSHINKLVMHINKDLILYSETDQKDPFDKQVMIIDNIGMLSSLYGYGHIAFIGGGFGKGIHNILEAAVHGMPVIFGPHYSKFKEALDMIDAGCAFSVSTTREFDTLVESLITNRVKYATAAQTAKDYVNSNTGATEIICSTVQQDIDLD